MVITTKWFFVAAIESWPDSNWNPCPLNSFQKLLLTEVKGRGLNLHSEPILFSCSNCIVCSVSGFISAVASISRHVYFNQNFLEVITWVSEMNWYIWYFPLKDSLNRQSLNSVQTLRANELVISTWAQVALKTNFVEPL